MKQFSRHWKSSKSARKQRKYRAQLPLHLRQRLLRAHLSTELKKRYHQRNVPVRAGDKVVVARGQFKKRDGKVERVDKKRECLYISGIEVVKKDGTKILFAIHPSNVVITELYLDDKRRKEQLEVTQ